MDNINTSKRIINIKDLCSYCREKIGTKHCSMCKKMNYCTKECQISHWNKNHKIVCKYLANIDKLVDETRDKYYTEQHAFFMQSLLYSTNRLVNYKLINTKTGKEMTDKDWKQGNLKYRQEKNKKGKPYIHYLVMSIIEPKTSIDNNKEDNYAVYLTSQEMEKESFIEMIRNDLGDNRELLEHPENIPIVTIRLFKRINIPSLDISQYFHLISFNCYLFMSNEERKSIKGNIKFHDIGTESEEKKQKEDLLEDMKVRVKREGIIPGEDLHVCFKLEGNIEIETIDIIQLSSQDGILISPTVIKDRIVNNNVK